MDNKTPQQRRAERQKYLRMQRGIRMGAIVLAIVLSIIALAQSCATKRAIDDLAAKIQAKKAAEAQMALSPEPQPEATALAQPQGTQITLSFVGSCVLGQDEEEGYTDSFQEYYDRYGASYFFQNVKSIFEGDDLTVATLDGTLTLSDTRQNLTEAIRADPSYGQILAAGGIDAVSVANAHSQDYGDEGYVDTLANLDNAQVGRFGYDNVLVLPTAAATAGGTGSVVETQGIPVGLSGVWEDSQEDYGSQALDNIAELQSQGAQIIVVLISWAESQDEIPNDDQILLAHKLISAGADLVVGVQPGGLQGIECYKGKYIAYSLGSFLSDGEIPTDTAIFQQTFTVSDGKTQENATYQIIPCSVSSEQGANTYSPTPATGDAAQQTLDRIYYLSDLLDGGIRPETKTDGT